MVWNQKNTSIHPNDNHQQPVNETESQDEDLSLDETSITSGLQAGLNYCRYMSAHMQDEIKKLQEKVDSTEQTNKVLKQNIVNLDNEKQKLITNFQKEFRKFEMINNNVKQLEGEIHSLKKFFETSIKLEEDIRQIRIEELKIRNNIQASFQEEKMKLEKTERFLSNKIQDLTEETKKTKIIEAEQSNFLQMKQHIRVLDQQLENKSEILSLNSNKNLAQDIENLKQKINLLKINDSKEVNITEAKLEQLPVQIRTEINSLRSQNGLIRDKIQSECDTKLAILADFRTKIQNEINRKVEINRIIDKGNLDLENLKKEKEINKEQLLELDNKLRVLNEEKKGLRDILNDISQETEKLRKQQSFSHNEREKLQENMKQLEIGKKSSKSQVNKINLIKKLNELESQKTSMQEENQGRQNEIDKLTTLKKSLETQNIELKNQSAVNKKCLEELDISKKHLMKQNMTHDEENEFLDQLRSLKTDEYSRMEIREWELDNLLGKFQTMFSSYTDLEFSYSQLQNENDESNNKICELQKTLRTISEEKDMIKNLIQEIKRNVYDGSFVTMQELNKKYNLMVNGKNVESEKVQKLQQEITNLKERSNFEEEELQTSKSTDYVAPIKNPSKKRKLKKLQN